MRDVEKKEDESQQRGLENPRSSAMAAAQPVGKATSQVDTDIYDLLNAILSRLPRSGARVSFYRFFPKTDCGSD
jgi:hypothetical protein